MILKSMKRWDKSSKLDEINRRQKVTLKKEKVKSEELFEKVFLKNNVYNFLEDNDFNQLNTFFTADAGVLEYILSKNFLF